MKRTPAFTRALWIIISLSLFAQSVGSVAYADDALVLPKGTWRMLVDGIFYLPITKRYNSNGDTEDVAKDYNTVVDSSVFPPLSALDSLVPGGKANIGTTVTSFKWDIKQATLQPAYGLTDKLSVGMNIPYWWMKNNVNFRLDASNANVGTSAIGAGFGAPLVPLAGGGPFGDAVPVTTQDVQSVLGPGLDVNGDGITDIPGFGIKPIQTWSKDGLGDIEAGGRYQYFNSETWRLAFTGGVRFPTGHVDDPDNLVDRGLGLGAYALLFRFQQDFVRQKPGLSAQMGVPEPWSFVINTTFRYDMILPDTQVLRVCSIHQPVCQTKTNVHRNYGDIVEAEISGSIGLPVNGLYITPLYKFGHSFKDRYSGKSGPDYGALESETDYSEQIYIVSLTYSTLPLFLEKRFPMPLMASISYRDRFAGNNNLFKSQYVSFTITTFF